MIKACQSAGQGGKVKAKPFFDAASDAEGLLGVLIELGVLQRIAKHGAEGQIEDARARVAAIVADGEHEEIDDEIICPQLDRVVTSRCSDDSIYSL